MVTVGETPAAEAPLQLRKVAHLPLCFRLRSSRGGLLLLYRTGWVIRAARSSLREGGGSNGGGGGGGGRRKGSRPGQVRFSLSLSIPLSSFPLSDGGGGGWRRKKKKKGRENRNVRSLRSRDVPPAKKGGNQALHLEYVDNEKNRLGKSGRKFATISEIN